MSWYTITINLPKEDVIIQRVTAPPPAQADRPDATELIGEYPNLYHFSLGEFFTETLPTTEDTRYYIGTEEIWPAHWDRSGHTLGGLTTALRAHRRDDPD